MQTERLSTGGEGAEHLLSELDRAIERAKAWDYDLPSEAALTRGRMLICAISEEMREVGNVEVSVGIDGSVDLFAANLSISVSIEVTPSGRVQGVSSDVREARILWNAKEPSVDEIVRELRRAA